jgi:2-iminobutanoate/2-iminopropanoate deaminase
MHPSRRHLSFNPAVSQASRAVVLDEPGPTVYLSGHVGLTPDGTAVLGGGIAGQARSVFDQLAATLEELGGTLADVVKMTVYLTDMAALEEFSQVRAEVFGTRQPASTSVQVAGLYGGAGLEVEAVAVLHQVAAGGTA